MSTTEIERALTLLKYLNKNGILLEALLQPPYQAILLHSSSTIITGNQAAAEMIHSTQEALIGLNAWTLFPPQSVQTVMEKLAQHTEEPYQVLARRVDGELFMVELKGINFEIKGEPVRAILMREV